jgi:myo-inositol-1(or 4)-monophosphatase
MNTQLDWQKILIESKNNVLSAIEPHIKTIHEPQLDLGRGAGGSLMKPGDLAAEKAIVETFQKNNISFTLISEESGFLKFGSTPDECYVTIDQIDGTTNFLRGLPFYASSIAVSRKPVMSEVFAGLVTDLYHDITYIALEGQGAFRDGQKIAPSKNASLDTAVVGLDLNTYKVKELHLV